MDNEQQLKLQAFLDGELAEADAREVASWVARDAGATALANELRNTRRAIKLAAPDVRVPESREFYWSKIQREIERLEVAPAPERKLSLGTWIRRLLIPTGAVAAVVAALLIAARQSDLIPAGHHSRSSMAVSDPGTFTYQDYENGTTLVWLSYPAER